MQTSWHLTERSCTRDPHTEILHKNPTESCCRHPDKEILHKRSIYRDPAQVVLQDPKRSWHKHLAHKILTHRSCTSAPTGSCWRDPDTDILHKKFSYSDLAQVALEPPDTDIPTQTSCTRHPHTVILHKWSYYRILAQRSWKRDLGQETRIQRSCTSGPRGTDIPTQTSCTRDPHTVILHKWSYYRILAQRSWKRDLGQETRIQRSCTSGPRGTDIPTQTSCTRDPHTVILHKWSYYRILAQRSWKRDLGQETRIQRSRTSCPRGCWCRNPDKDIWQKWYYRILMQRSWHGLGIHDFQQENTATLFRVSCRDNLFSKCISVSVIFLSTGVKNDPLHAKALLK